MVVYVYVYTTICMSFFSYVCIYYYMYVLFLIPFLNARSASGSLWSDCIISTNLVCIHMYGKYGDKLYY
jgi:hypothetical protein